MFKRRVRFAMAAATCLSTCALGARAEEAKVSTGGAAALGRPTTAYFELGVFGGLLVPSSTHNLYSRTWEPFKVPVPELGARGAFYPLSFAGIEAEGFGGPTETEDTDKSAALWGARGHLILQLPGPTLVPFVLVGGGVLTAGSNPTGTDTDPLFHFGAGAKLNLDDFIGLRLDVRDNITQKHDSTQGTPTHHPEATLGIAFTLDTRSPPPPPPPDADADGITDADDKCPKQAGPAPTGCPPPPDADADGLEDSRDGCPNEAGPAPTGCPDKDPDHDCVPLPEDKCPTEAGIAPDGCPDPDPDRDGVQGAADKCPNEPETKNLFEDEDGCPDTIPEKVKKFSGVIPGIEFDLGKATIRPKSKGTLNEAADVLKEFPSLRIQIQGHTDNVGTREKNVKLSGERAESVKQYLVDQGIAGKRIETEGVGPDRPIEDNKTAAGRQKNRRIEFKLIGQ
jgi:outer membrane protein OmpA-like peptidoglycan-associated protein